MFGLIAALLVLTAATYGASWLPQPPDISPPQNIQDPLAALKERYLRGEISGEDYEDAREMLED